MSERWFISYSSVDSKECALRLADGMTAGPPEIPVWLDQRDLRPGEDWDEQIAEALRTCKGLLFVMTSDSVQPNSVCKNEWVRALKYKKPIIPLLKDREAELPFRLGSRQYIDFSGSWEGALARLRRHLTWIDSSAGQLQALKDRLADAKRELPRAQPQQQVRIRDDIAELERQIAQQQAVVDNPQAAERRTQESIERGLERKRQPATNSDNLTSSTSTRPSISRLLKQELEDLQEPYDLLREKLKRLRAARAIAVMPDMKFALDKNIKDTVQELNQFKLQIEEIKRQLG